MAVEPFPQMPTTTDVDPDSDSSASSDDDDDDESDGTDYSNDGDLCPNISLPLTEAGKEHTCAIKCPVHVFDLDMHPAHDTAVVAAALVSGDVAIYRYEEERGTAGSAEFSSPHSESCRAVKFLGDQGKRLVSASATGQCVVAEVDGKVIWRTPQCEDGINALCLLSETSFAAGDDNGTITIWDSRTKAEPVSKFREYDEYVSCMASARNSQYIVATAGDKLGVYDLRKPKDALWAMSDQFSSDLLSIALIKNETKVLVGSDSGNVWIFSWGDFGTAADSVGDHPQSVDALVALPDDTLLSGCSDGHIRVLTVYPNKVVGTVGTRGEGNPGIDALAVDASTGILAASSMDEYIRFYDTADAMEQASKAYDDHQEGRRHPKGGLQMPAAGAFFNDL